MSFRKSVLLVGCVSLLAIAGLVLMLITLGLAVGYRAVAHSPPTPTPTKTPRPTVVATSTPTPIVMVAATSLPTDALSPPLAAASVPNDTSIDTSIPSDTTGPSPTDTPIPSDTQAGAPAPTNTLPDTPVPSPTLTASPASTDGSTPTPAPTNELTPTPASTAEPTPTPASTAELTPTPASTAEPTPIAAPTNEPTPTPTLVTPGRITGRLLLDGAPVSEGVTLKLENQSYDVIAETTVGADGAYAFTELQPSSGGYNVLFAQEWNSQYGTDQVVSWGWLGPVAVEDGAVVELPDFDVSLLGFGQVSPKADATFSAATISPANPITFKWTAYPQAAKYWVDLVHGEGQELAWQSLIQATSFAFDGTVDNGEHIQPGEYWWGVGARRESGPYPLTVYGYLPGLIIEP